MFTEPMNGPVAWSIVWLWWGFIAVGSAAYLVYRLLRPWLKSRKPPPPAPMKYAEQLRQRLRKKPSRPGHTPPKGAGAGPKPPSSTK